MAHPPASRVRCLSADRHSHFRFRWPGTRGNLRRTTERPPHCHPGDLGGRPRLLEPEISMINSFSPSEATKKQQCTLTHLYSGALVFVALYASGLVLFAYRGDWPALFLWWISLPCAR